MAEGDNFQLLRGLGAVSDQKLLSIVIKSSTPRRCSFYFDTRRRTQTTVRIEVRPVMKWEARFVHRLLALVVCRIILERRHSGAQPIRVKERPRGSVGGSRSRSRRQLR